MASQVLAEELAVLVEGLLSSLRAAASMFQLLHKRVHFPEAGCLPLLRNEIIKASFLSARLRKGFQAHLLVFVDSLVLLDIIL
jgi:hypothetical protein